MEEYVDRHIGRRLRARRRSLGLTQAELAELVGVCFQQIHKYECGVNRTSSATLFKMACVLDVSVHYFFDGLVELRAAAEAPAFTDRPPPPGELNLGA